MPLLKQAAAFVWTVILAWLSQGTLALTDAGVGIDRIALLHFSHSAVLLSVLAAVLALAAVRWGAPLVSLAPLALCALPWLPAPVPAAALLWSGPLALLPWAASAGVALASLSRKRGVVVRRPVVAAGVSAAVLYSLAASSVAPTLPGGDEPHYLIITQSLLADRDLRIENNHRRGDYRAYFAGELRPDFLKRGVDGDIYSIHAPGLPALVAPAFAIGGYRGVMVFLVLLSALGSALAWHVGWLATGRSDAAWFGWAAVTLGVTNVFHTFSVYPDGAGGVIVLTGAWALIRAESTATRSWLLHGAALALLPWLHTRFALLAGTLGLLLLLRIWATPDRVTKSLAFLAVPAASCAAWIAFFVTIYGVANPSAPYGGGELGSAAYVADGLAGLLFDQRFGLLMYAPVLVFAFAGFGATPRRLAIELAIVVIPYLLLVTYFRMWWAGWSAPARFAAPIVPLLAIPAALAWVAIRRRGTRATAAGALLVTGILTIALAGIEHGRLAYNTRVEPSLLLRWLERAADLSAALPAWSVQEGGFFRDVAIWCAAMVAAWAIVRAVDRTQTLRGRASLAAAAAAVFALAGMTASAIVWHAKDIDGTAPVPGQLALLRRAADDARLLGVSVAPPRTLDRHEVPRALRLTPALLEVPNGPAADRAPLVLLPAVPAGTYRVRPTVRGTAGTLTIGLGREAWPLHVASGLSPDPIVLNLPVAITGLVIRGDAGARQNLRSVAIEPLSLVGPSERLTRDYAHRVMTYAGTRVFFVDDRSFPEPDAFWVGGARSSSVVLQPEASRAAVSLHLRNAPVDNRVSLESGAWRVELQLSPGEERQLGVPIDAQRGSALLRISTSSGFRPSEVDPASHDDRFLGIWIRVN